MRILAWFEATIYSQFPLDISHTFVLESGDSHLMNIVKGKLYESDRGRFPSAKCKNCYRYFSF
ncbi:hypothetical protein VIBNIAM115_1850052 [Vibrio nigripulchritudo AM115]|nr:hypothetical protein VIBNIAM115_1850052 [Vibrio nigripulchritudo AM115]